MMKYKKGKENIVADALSREDGDDRVECEVVSLVEPTWLEEVKQMVRESNYFAKLEKKNYEGQLNKQNYKKQGGVWFYKGRVLLDSQSPLCSQVISEHHDTPTGGHSSYHRILHRVKRTFWWKGMKADVKKAVRECDMCQRHKHESMIPPGLLDPSSVPVRVWEGISMDFIEDLLVSNGKTTILVMVDRFFKYAHFIALKNPINTSQLAVQFFDHVGKLYDVPNSIVSDRERLFTGEFWKELFQFLGHETQIQFSLSPAI